MTQTNKRKNWVWSIASILLASLGALAPTALAQNFDGSGGSNPTVQPFTLPPQPTPTCVYEYDPTTGAQYPCGWSPPPQVPSPQVAPLQGLPPGFQSLEQGAYALGQALGLKLFESLFGNPAADQANRQAAAAQAAAARAQQEAAEQAARVRREQEARAVAAALQRARDEFEHGKRATLAALKGVVQSEGFKGLGTSTNFFSLKGFKPIPREALTTPTERMKAETSQCFDSGGCTPLTLPRVHLSAPPDGAAVPAWVQQTPQYQAQAQTLQKLQAEAADTANRLQAAQQAFAANPDGGGTGQAQVEALQQQSLDLQQQIAAQNQLMVNTNLQLQAERPAGPGGAAPR